MRTSFASLLTIIMLSGTAFANTDGNKPATSTTPATGNSGTTSGQNTTATDNAGANNANIVGKVEDVKKTIGGMNLGGTSNSDKVINALGTSLTGKGGIDLLQGMGEKASDTAASSQINAVIGSYRCRVAGVSGNNEGGGRGGNQNTTNPTGGQAGKTPGESTDLINDRHNYMTLAAKTREWKQILGLAPGIESREVIDNSEIYSSGAAHVSNKEGIFADTTKARLDSGSADKLIKKGTLELTGGLITAAFGKQILAGLSKAVSGKTEAQKAAEVSKKVAEGCPNNYCDPNHSDYKKFHAECLEKQAKKTPPKEGEEAKKYCTGAMTSQCEKVKKPGTCECLAAGKSVSECIK